MRAKRNLAKQQTKAEKSEVTSISLEAQFQVLVKQLSAKPLNLEEALNYSQRFNKALHKAVKNKNPGITHEFPEVDTIVLQEIGSTKEKELAEDSRSVKRLTSIELFKKTISLLIAIALITLGFSMIILPAPPYFEMFTIFYFNDEDGVTIMDLISLIIILCGVYLFITTVIKKPNANTL